MDMIKCPDAAELKTTGRFYLQVGYNELFAMGQAAWAGAQYYPTEKRKKKVDQSINVIDNVGSIIKSLDTKQNDVSIPSKGEEINNIIKYIVDESKKENIQVEQLWLPRIPDVIYTDQLKEKYNYITTKNVIAPIIGEYDDPDNQTQNILALPLSDEGNTIIFGSAGSGKELMLSGIIYSCITTHDSKEINFYIIDFGAETLTMFRKAPHVGEVMLSVDNEKIDNMFKMISQVIEERKKIFVDYNGSYDFYINHGGKQIPLITIIINNVEAFFETYPDYEELVGQMTRDCLKYGVVFIFSTNGPNTVRYRLRQNFKQNVVLQFNDPMDYASVIPGVRKKEPSKSFGRGLISLDSIFEFQTSYPYQEEKMSDYIKIICNKLNNICDYQAQSIPILPEVVSQEMVSNYLGNIRTIPVGVVKETLEIAKVDLSSRFMYNITGDDVTTDTRFIRGFINNLLTIDNSKCVILDVNNIIDEIKSENVTYDTDTCRNAIEQLYLYFDENNPDITIFPIIIGVNALMGKLSSIEKGKFQQFITECKTRNNFKYIIIDTIDVLKSISFETWYKGNSDASEGIWLGNGIANQFTLKVTTNSRVLRADVEPGFGYCIQKGKANLIKLMSDE